MRKLQWMLARTGECMGAPGLAALALAACTLLYLPLVLWPTQQQLVALEQVPLRGKVASPPPAPATAAASQFLAGLPASDTLPAQLQSLFGIAAQYELDLGEVAYKWERNQGARVLRYQVNFTADAPYPDTRAFLADVLATLPHAALEQLSFNRDSVQSDSVRTTVRLTLHLLR